MRKRNLLSEIKLLIEQNKILSDTVEENKNQIEELIQNNKNDKNMEKISSLDLQLKACMKENDELKGHLANLIEKFEESAEQNEKLRETINDINSKKEEELQKPRCLVDAPEDFVPIEFNDDIAAASSEIGKVVVKITEFCSKTAAEGNENAKELINMALGRGEVYKADVMTIISSANGSLEEKLVKINVKSQEIEQYINNLYAQL